MGPKKAEPQNQAKSPTRFHEEAVKEKGGLRKEKK
jgi:hypothetical protein